MKVKVLSCKWEMGQGISLKDFTDFLSRVGPSGIEHGKLRREIYMGNANGSYLAGVALTLRDQTRFLTTSTTGTSIRITPEQLNGAKRLADCNIFLIHQNTGRGLYTHYHKSVGVSGLQCILRRHYSTLKDNLIAQATMRYANGGDIKGKHQRKAQSDYKGMMSISLQLRSDSLSSILDELEEVNAFEFNYERLLPNTSEFRPLKLNAKSEKIRITFKKDVSASCRKSSIIKAIEAAALSQGKVEGKKADGTTSSIPLKRNPDIYEEWDFDDFADELNFEIADLSDSDPIKRLMSIIDNNKSYFERP